MGKVIYLTGAPATGKTSLCGYLKRHVPNLEHVAYRELLIDTVADRCGDVSVQALREAPCRLITRADVDTADKRLIDIVMELRARSHVIVDSHAMSKEPYGFRITPFKPEQVAALDPDVIVCLYTDPVEISRRIQANAEGRPLPSAFELAMHVTLQTTVAAQYAFNLGRQCHLLDSSKPVDRLGETICQIAGI